MLTHLRELYGYRDLLISLAIRGIGARMNNVIRNVECGMSFDIPHSALHIPHSAFSGALF